MKEYELYVTGFKILKIDYFHLWFLYMQKRLRISIVGKP